MFDVNVDGWHIKERKGNKRGGWLKSGDRQIWVASPGGNLSLMSFATFGLLLRRWVENEDRVYNKEHEDGGGRVIDFIADCLDPKLDWQEALECSCIRYGNPSLPIITVFDNTQDTNRVLGELNPSEGIALFTDGSAWDRDKSGGWAWLAIDAFEGEAESSGGIKGTTNNRMEMTAWIEGLCALRQVLGPCRIIVISDSEYVGLGAMDRTRGRKCNNDLWEKLDAAIDAHLYVEFAHVRGHSGHVWNERVDKLAGEARRRHNGERRTHKRVADWDDKLRNDKRIT